jgi:hypothetical protein
MFDWAKNVIKQRFLGYMINKRFECREAAKRIISMSIC